MPSRKGSRKGRKTMKRSLRFMPKLVIKERSETIEDTLNATIGRTAYRIPRDVSNIIQGYEGGADLYFEVDMFLNRFSLSTTTPFKKGKMISIKSNTKDIDFDDPPFYVFQESELNVSGFDDFNNISSYVYNIYMVFSANNAEDAFSKRMTRDYIIENYDYLISKAKNSLIEKGFSKRINTTVNKLNKYVFNSYDDQPQDKIIFEKVIDNNKI